MALTIYSCRIGTTRVSAELRMDGEGRLRVVELLDGKPDGEPMPYREYIKEYPEWGEEVREAARRLWEAVKPD